jgi:hypothetical protein
MPGETEDEGAYKVERLSLWRELPIAQLLVRQSILETFSCLRLFESIDKLPVACSSSPHKRIPRLCVFSSA